MSERGLQRFLLFTAPARGARKLFVASFRTIDEAVASVENAKAGAGAYWQVVERSSNQVVAEDMSHLG